MALVFIVGVPMALWGFWKRLGRTPGARAWSTGDNPERWLFLIPFLGAALVLLGLSSVLQDAKALAALLGLVGIVAALIGLVFGLFNVPAPAWLEPRWYRELDRRVPRRSPKRAAPVPAPASPAAPRGDPAWTPVRDAVRADLATLHPEGSVMATADAQRFVEIYHYGDRLCVECAGSQEWGGPALVGAEAEARLIDLGFTTPMDRRHEVERSTAYRVYLPTDRPEAVADRAADLAVAALAILGVQPTDALDLVVS